MNSSSVNSKIEFIMSKMPTYIYNIKTQKCEKTLQNICVRTIWQLF